MNRRHLMLEEMGLAPVWRLRQPADPGTVDANASAGLSPSAIEPAARGTRPENAKADPPERTVGTRAAPPAVAAAAVVVAPEDEARRRTAVLKMDWTALKAAVAGCVACPLHAKRTQTVFGVGDEQAHWMFVGEGPGAEEDAKGEPFVGQAGRLLDNMLAAIDLKRGENVYIANVVKCRPPSNRNPESGEMRCCEPYLSRQIELIRPTLIVALGKIAASHLLSTDASIASLRGRVHDYRGTPLIVTYHPAYLLRTLPDKAKSWADLCFARDTMRALTSDGQTVAPLQS